MKLTTTEASLLVDTIDQAIEGHKESKQAAAEDPNIKTPETLVEVMNDIDNTVDTLTSIRKKVMADGTG